MRRKSSTQILNQWPGFVDALASLLMVITFVLMIFMVSQFYLSDTISGQDKTLGELKEQITRITNAFNIEKEEKVSLNTKVTTLKEELQQLNDHIKTVTQALGATEEQLEFKNLELEDVSSQLQQALAEKVKDLSKYRSEFFGKLRESIGTREDIRIVGDRFVFQSEVLFSSGSSTIGKSGKSQLKKFAETLKAIIPTIPEDIDWVLRVDGHTDKMPIKSSKFQSNWDLSTSRALSVIRYLIEQGIPSNRLAATGFAEHQPLESGNSAQSMAKNRRIEMRFDQR